ncbi:hypothetical protein CSC36_3625 [Pseudomonas aeruginosa]|nr:hypothetical protein CSC36_3625 [Pseudomonas aeruginosa]
MVAVVTLVEVQFDAGARPPAATAPQEGRRQQPDQSHDHQHSPSSQNAAEPRLDKIPMEREAGCGGCNPAALETEGKNGNSLNPTNDRPLQGVTAAGVSR